jgi:hypothetical protein
MTSWTSALLRCLIVGLSCWGVSRGWLSASTSSGSYCEGCGWKTSVKCSAKACAFLTLLLAQFPCDVLSGGEVFFDLTQIMKLLICYDSLTNIHIPNDQGRNYYSFINTIACKLYWTSELLMYYVSFFKLSTDQWIYSPVGQTKLLKGP